MAAQATHTIACSLAHLSSVEAAICASMDFADFAYSAPSPSQTQHQLYQLAFWSCAAMPPSAQCSPFATACAYPAVAAHAQQHQPQHGAPLSYPAPAMAAPVPGLYTAVCPAPAPVPSPPPAPSPAVLAPQPACQQGKGGAKADSKAAKASASGQPSRKASGSPRSKASKASASSTAAAPPASASAQPASAASAEEALKPGDIELDAEDIRKLLEDDRDFLQFPDEEMSEGSNGSSNTAEGARGLLRQATSRDSLSASRLNDGLLVDGVDDGAGSFAHAFDMDTAEDSLSDLPCWTMPATANSCDLNNMACPTSPSAAAPAAGGSPKSGQAAAAAAQKAGAAGCAKAAAAGAAGAGTKITLRVKGGVQKAGGVAAAVKAAAAAKAGGKGAGGSEDCALTAADLSRLLGEEDTSIPDGWDLDLDFENPFSTPISAF